MPPCDRALEEFIPVAPIKSLAAILLALAPLPASARLIERAPDTHPATSALAMEPAETEVTAVDAPPVLPLFAGALALLGWRLGRRRRR